MSKTTLQQSEAPARHNQPIGLLSAQRLLAVGVAASLAVDAYVHLHDAGFYDLVRSNVLSEATLFRVQAAIAVAAAVVVLIWPRPLSWAASLTVAGTAFSAVMVYTYVRIGALGPLPNMFEPTWALPGKLVSAWAEGAGTAASLVGLVLAVRHRESLSSRTGDATSDSSVDEVLSAARSERRSNHEG